LVLNLFSPAHNFCYWASFLAWFFFEIWSNDFSFRFLTWSSWVVIILFGFEPLSLWLNFMAHSFCFGSNFQTIRTLLTEKSLRFQSWFFLESFFSMVDWSSFELQVLLWFQMFSSLVFLEIFEGFIYKLPFSSPRPVPKLTLNHHNDTYSVSSVGLYSFQGAASLGSTNKLHHFSDILQFDFLEFEKFLKHCFDFFQKISAIKNLILVLRFY